jgi:arsenite-transporting ATPase
VVIDTTGHTLLLLDTAGSYHRDIMRNINSGRLRTHMSLQDHELSKIILVSLPNNPMRDSFPERFKQSRLKPTAY